MPRSQGKRCHGFRSPDGEWVRCARPEHAGSLTAEDDLYVHKMHSECNCGVTHGRARERSNEIEATYDYRDESGTLLSQQVRLVGKRFQQRRPDGAGGWIWNVQGVRLVPYRLPDLLADDGDRPVYFPEGEKDVDALRERGHVATCNPMGAEAPGRKSWKTTVANEARAVLKDREVVVIADDDDIGRKHARMVADDLRFVARSIRVVKCPNHKDISDHLAAGGTIDQLVGLEAETTEPAADGPTAAEPMRGLVHLPKVAIVGRDRILELANRPVVWIWDYITTAGVIILLAAGAGSGKTTLLFLIIIARANRGPAVSVLGHVVTPSALSRRIVVIENEHSDESASRILVKSSHLLGVADNALDSLILVARSSVRIGSPEWQDVERLIRAGLVSDIALDTLARVSPESDANDEGDQVAIFDRIARAIEMAPAAEARPTVWVAAHIRKCDGMPTLNDVSGSNQRAGQPDVVILMGANRTAGRVTSVTAVFGKVREKDPEDWPRPVNYTVNKTNVTMAGSDKQDDDLPLVERVFARLQLGPRTANALATELSRNKTDVNAALTALLEAGRIERTPIDVRGRIYKGFKVRPTAPQPQDVSPRGDSRDAQRTSRDVSTEARKTGQVTQDPSTDASTQDARGSPKGSRRPVAAPSGAGKKQHRRTTHYCETGGNGQEAVQRPKGQQE
jgi:hypothetical protein